VSGRDQFSDDGGADESGRAGNESTHIDILMVETKATISSFRITVKQ
jgi:hypothetical protein